MHICSCIWSYWTYAMTNHLSYFCLSSAFITLSNNYPPGSRCPPQRALFMGPSVLYRGHDFICYISIQALITAKNMIIWSRMLFLLYLEFEDEYLLSKIWLKLLYVAAVFAVPHQSNEVLKNRGISANMWTKIKFNPLLLYFLCVLAICAGNSPVTGEFPAQRPVTRSFNFFFDLHLNKRLSKQWWGWWFQTPLLPLWRHCNDGGHHGNILKRSCALYFPTVAAVFQESRHQVTWCERQKSLQISHCWYFLGI